MNPDGYDYTFQTRGTRLWRKNLRDNNGDGSDRRSATASTPTATSPTKWRYDHEGASDRPGERDVPRPVAELRARGQGRSASLMDAHQAEVPRSTTTRTRSSILYPSRLAGGDATATDDAADGGARGQRPGNPAVPGYRPRRRSAELYTTNGDITDDDVPAARHPQAYTVELDGGSGAPVGGTTTAGNAVGSNPAGFVFQDREADVQAVFAEEPAVHARPRRSRRPRPTSRPRTSARRSPDFVPATFATSYGAPQTVEVNVAPRARRRARLKWQVQGSATVADRLHRRSSTAASATASPASTTTACAARSPASRPGDKVDVWFEAGGKSSTKFTFTASALGRGNQVLILSRRGLQRDVTQHDARHGSELPRDLHRGARRRRHPRRRLRHRRQAAATWRTCSACSVTTARSSGTRAPTTTSATRARP